MESRKTASEKYSLNHWKIYKNEVIEIQSDLHSIYIPLVFLKTEVIGYIKTKITFPYRYVLSILWKTKVRGC